ncbi:LRR receptor-like serine/threonine-protein kinase [Populus alba x Populus x berolinensis]|nr:LRR receptor-like serine/threonine-protein kinase [Populus alba x Populus x berolinensis]
MAPVNFIQMVDRAESLRQNRLLQGTAPSNPAQRLQSSRQASSGIGQPYSCPKNRFHSQLSIRHDSGELYATGLQGPIPLEIFHLEKLSDLRIADMPGPEFQLPNSPIERVNLVLRNINLNGTIPEGVWKVEKTLDLTFNKLVGEIPPNTIRRQFLSGNKLTGTVQDPFLQSSQNLLTADSTAFNFVMLISYAS